MTGARAAGPGPGEPPPSVAALARCLADRPGGLPAYVYDLAGLAGHAAAIRAALPPGVQLYYAVKANPDPAILTTLARHVDGFEVASGGELDHVGRHVPGAPLAFGGPGKTAAELSAALRLRAARIHVESVHELRLLAALAGGRPVEVLLRVNLGPAGPGAALAMGGTTPFGLDPAGCAGAAAVAAGLPGIRLRGLHAHLASGLDAAAAAATAHRVISFARPWCAERGIRRPEIVVGGGMAVDYGPAARPFDWAGYGRALARLVGPDELVRIEPGRAVTAPCGWYLTRVLDIRRVHGATFAVVAGGTHHLRTPAARGHAQPFRVIPLPRWPWPWPRPAAGPGPVTLVGQLCTPRDVLARDVAAPGLRAGDLVAFGLAGAYAWHISHHDFLMHPGPGFHHLPDGPARVTGARAGLSRRRPAAPG